MNCAETKRLVDAYVDNELDLRSALDLEEHLSGCEACGAEEKGLRELQTSARANLTRYSPSPELEARLREAIGIPQAEAPRAAVIPLKKRWSWTALVPVAAAAAALVAVVPQIMSRPPELADSVLNAHVRSLLADHITDVASSDQHTVKPWFQGKLDYSVTVTDWVAEGFPLIGGRLDYVDNTQAAALVYKRAQHVVNLFVWPGKPGHDEPVKRLCRRGYNAIYWAKDGMHYWAISDLNETELQQFVELVRHKG
jgi:anti-sigma factor RsiW